ncbi:Hint domain-containing protein [Burkholderia sp. TSV86]|uniref:Hint domain-containing protein n=1 Tax=Burkholderia sp. TSV86 TaxID=1385594 RepID=UPI000752BBDD|nr:Hint domain-containing protein [Burkholderia sp. TSV86]KVE40047.1 hypothetical protein WS68_18365 [Burkholderia sp. TSV86]
MSQTFNNVTFSGPSATAGVNTLGLFTGTNLFNTLGITGVVVNGTIDVPGGSSPTVTWQLANGTAALASNATYLGYSINNADPTNPTYYFSANLAGISTPITFAVTFSPSGTGFLSIAQPITTTATSAPPSTSTTPVCFGPGTKIRTTRGDIAVEDLKVGDIAITSSGRERPIVWIGKRTVTRTHTSNFDESRPVRVMAGALGENLPTEDLVLSPGHSLCLSVLDELFVPVRFLANGSTIAYIDVDEVTYWHVELDEHDVLIANGVYSESYKDCGNRGWFMGHGGNADPDVVNAALAEYARPFVINGPVIDALRSRIAVRARELGWTITNDMDVHLVVDGQRVDGDIENGQARFLFPATAKEVQLISKTFTPAEFGLGDDPRKLGVCVSGLHVTDGLSFSKEIALDDAELSKGFYGLEPQNNHRWTNGNLSIPSTFWSGCKSHVFLRLSFRTDAGFSWVEPASQAADEKVLTLRAA